MFSLNLLSLNRNSTIRSRFPALVFDVPGKYKIPLNYTAIFMLLMLCSFSVYAVQTCNDLITKSAGDERYLNPGDGTIIDLQTGLMWQQCSIGQAGADCAGVATDFTWVQALQEPISINSNSGFAGYNDWRLPNVNELFSLVEVACTISSINLTMFPNTPGFSFWSSSPYTVITATWMVYFSYGYSVVNKRESLFPMRLVRSVY